MKRLEYLDQMKAVAIFLMVMGHVLLFTFDVSECTLSNVFFINMPIFFYVSGFLLYKKIDTLHELVRRIKHKTSRLLPPWLAASLMMVLGYNWRFLPTLCNFYWFFYVLFLLTMMIIIMDFFVFRHIKNTIAYCAALILVPVLFACQKFTGYYDCYLPAHHLCMYSIPFLLGWACNKYKDLHTFVIENRWLYMVSIVLFFYCWHKFPQLNNYVHLLGALCGIVVLQSALYHKEQVCNKIPILSRVGQSTLSIYALNYIFLPDLKMMFIGEGKIIEYGLLVQFVITGFVAVGVIAACMCVEWLFHNNKYLSKIL